MIGIALLVLIGVIALIVMGVRKLTHGGEGRVEEGQGVRQTFQYLLLFGLLIISAIGITGLLSRLLEPRTLVDVDQVGLARNLTFTVIGLPLYVSLALWSRRRMAQDPDESRSAGWAAYLTGASVVSLIVAMFALHDVLQWALQITTYHGDDLARFITWGTVWGIHWYVDRQVRVTTPTTVHHLLGSIIGLGATATGLVQVLSASLDSLVFSRDDLVAGQSNKLLRGLATLVIGAAVWAVYWLRTTLEEERTPLWNGYVLVAGVAGGLIAAITAITAFLHTSLVWFIGDPRTSSAIRHFSGVPEMVAVTAVGLLAWWYHRSVLADAGTDARTEPRRVYEYLMAGIGLLAAGAGLATLLVAFIEAIAGDADVLVGRGAINTLLLAGTILVVGGPLWWFYWRGIQRQTGRDPEGEHASPARRIYLLLLFGVGGVAAVTALIVGVFIFFEDLFQGRIGANTLHRARYALGALATTGTIAAYHWGIYRSDREAAPTVIRQGPRFVLLVGEPDRQIAAEVSRRTGGHVTSWPRADGVARPWSVEEIMEAVQSFEGGEVVVVSDSDGLSVVPIRRGSR